LPGVYVDVGCFARFILFELFQEKDKEEAARIVAFLDERFRTGSETLRDLIAKIRFHRLIRERLQAFFD
jgi:hypothetical protein